MKRRLYSYRDEEFILEPLYESVVRVTYREQTGYVGLNRDWEADRPYTWINWEGDIDEGGISASISFSYPVPELALEALCRALLREQRKQDSQRINPEERKKAGRQIFRNFWKNCRKRRSRVCCPVCRKVRSRNQRRRPYRKMAGLTR